MSRSSANANAPLNLDEVLFACPHINDTPLPYNPTYLQINPSPPPSEVFHWPHTPPSVSPTGSLPPRSFGSPLLTPPIHSPAPTHSPSRRQQLNVSTRTVPGDMTPPAAPFVLEREENQVQLHEKLRALNHDSLDELLPAAPLSAGTTEPGIPDRSSPNCDNADAEPRDDNAASADLPEPLPRTKPGLKAAKASKPQPKGAGAKPPRNNILTSAVKTISKVAMKPKPNSKASGTAKPAAKAGTPRAGTPRAGSPATGTPKGGTPKGGTPRAGTPPPRASSPLLPTSRNSRAATPTPRTDVPTPTQSSSPALHKSTSLSRRASSEKNGPPLKTKRALKSAAVAAASGAITPPERTLAVPPTDAHKQSRGAASPFPVDPSNPSPSAGQAAHDTGAVAVGYAAVNAGAAAIVPLVAVTLPDSSPPKEMEPDATRPETKRTQRRAGPAETQQSLLAQDQLLHQGDEQGDQGDELEQGPQRQGEGEEKRRQDGAMLQEIDREIEIEREIESERERESERGWLEDIEWEKERERERLQDIQRELQEIDREQARERLQGIERECRLAGAEPEGPRASWQWEQCADGSPKRDSVISTRSGDEVLLRSGTFAYRSGSRDSIPSPLPGLAPLQPVPGTPAGSSQPTPSPNDDPSYPPTSSPGDLLSMEGCRSFSPRIVLRGPSIGCSPAAADVPDLSCLSPPRSRPRPNGVIATGRGSSPTPGDRKPSPSGRASPPSGPSPRDGLAMSWDEALKRDRSSENPPLKRVNSTPGSAGSPLQPQLARDWSDIMHMDHSVMWGEMAQSIDISGFHGATDMMASSVVVWTAAL